MMILIILSTLLLLLLTFLLVTPILLKIDTNSPRPLMLIWRGILRYSLVVDGERFYNELIFLGIKKEIPFRRSEKKEPKQRKKRSLTLHKVINLLRSFKVKSMNWELDTENYVLNAQLYSVVWMLERPHIHIQLNFLGQNRLRLVVVNRLIRLVWAFIKK